VQPQDPRTDNLGEKNGPVRTGSCQGQGRDNVDTGGEINGAKTKKLWELLGGKREEHKKSTAKNKEAGQWGKEWAVEKRKFTK